MKPEPHGLGPHSDLTYRVIENLTLEGTDLRQCLFTGAVFRQTTFVRVNFRRSDFDAARFEGCTFVECDLSIDMRSALFVNTIFEACTFGTAFVTDCSFNGCRFERIHFDDCAISHNEFVDCAFRQSSLTQSTFVHNVVRNSIFSDTNMGDCTFLYVVMKGCEFAGCSMNLESVGMIYGLSPLHMKRFRYVHLGVEQPLPDPEELVATLLQQYADRQWRIGVAVIRLNFRLAAPLFTFHRYLADTQTVFAGGTPLNREEMLFVGKLMSELAEESRLPLATCFDVSRWCAAAVESAQDAKTLDVERTTAVLRELSARALMLSQDGLRTIETSDVGFALSSSTDASAVARFCFAERPAIDLAALITEIAVETGLPVHGRSVRMRSEHGSWIEYIQTTLISLAAIRVFLYFINGVLYDVTEARARITTLTRVRLPKEFLDVALRPQAPISASLVSPLKAIANEALRVTWVGDPHLSGLDAPNVKSVQVIDGSESHTTAVAPQ